MTGILFPTDFSNNSRKALDYALVLADKVVNPISLMHVYDLDVPEHRMTQEEIQTEIQLKETKMFERFQTFIKGVDCPTNFQHILHRGAVVSNIISHTNKNQVAWLVVCTKRTSTFKDFFFGSNIEEIIEHTRSSVIVVPENKPEFRPIQKIAYATNFVDDNILALQELDEFANLFNAEIVVLHVDDNVTDNDRAITEKYKSALSKMFTTNFSLQVIQHKNITESVKEYIENNEVDMLAMLKKRRNLTHKLLHNSLTEQMITQSTRPVLVLQEKTTLGN